MPLNGLLLGELCGVITQAYDRNSLEQLFLLRLDLDLFKDLASPNQHFGGVVFEALRNLDDPKLEEFIKVVIKDRPQRADLQQTLPPLLVALASPPATNTGPRGKDAIQLLDKVADDAAQLRAYKSMHDALHFLQLQRRSLAVSVRMVQTDPQASDDLRAWVVQANAYRDVISASIPDLPPAPPSVRAYERGWLQSLEVIIDLAQQCADQRTLEPGRRSEFGLRSLLRREQPRLDSIMGLTAGDLKIDILETLAAEAAGGPSLPADILQVLADGRAACKKLVDLLQIHRQWQWADQQFWEAEENLPRPGAADPGDFALLWSQLADGLEALAVAESLPVSAKRVRDAIREVNQRFENSDWADLANAFKRLRTECAQRFFSVDAELKALVIKVAALGDPLRRFVSHF